jgi:excisionase family DNA binding protein
MALNPIPVHERVTLSPQQAADMLGVSKPTLQKFIDSGELPSFLLCSRRLIYRESLLDLVRTREAKFTTAARDGSELRGKVS